MLEDLQKTRIEQTTLCLIADQFVSLSQNLSRIIDSIEENKSNLVDIEDLEEFVFTEINPKLRNNIIDLEKILQDKNIPQYILDIGDEIKSKIHEALLEEDCDEKIKKVYILKESYSNIVGRILETDQSSKIQESSPNDDLTNSLVLIEENTNNINLIASLNTQKYLENEINLSIEKYGKKDLDTAAKILLRPDYDKVKRTFLLIASNASNQEISDQLQCTPQDTRRLILQLSELLCTLCPVFNAQFPNKDTQNRPLRRQNLQKFIEASFLYYKNNLENQDESEKPTLDLNEAPKLEYPKPLSKTIISENQISIEEIKNSLPETLKEMFVKLENGKIEIQINYDDSDNPEYTVALLLMNGFKNGGLDKRLSILKFDNSITTDKFINFNVAKILNITESQLSSVIANNKNQLTAIAALLREVILGETNSEALEILRIFDENNKEDIVVPSHVVDSLAPLSNSKANRIRTGRVIEISLNGIDNHDLSYRANYRD